MIEDESLLLLNVLGRIECWLSRSRSPPVAIVCIHKDEEVCNKIMGVGDIRTRVYREMSQ